MKTARTGSSTAAVRGLARSVSLYTVALFTSGAMRMLALPLVVHAVSPGVYGGFATLWILMPVIHGISDLGLGTAALRLAPEQACEADRRALFATMGFARAVSASVIVTVVLVFRVPIATALTGSAESADALLWLVLARPIAMLSEASNDELRSRGAIKSVSGLIVLEAGLGHSLSVLFTMGLGLELSGLVWAQGLAEVAAFAVAFALCFRHFRAMPSLAMLRRLLAFGWPFGVLYVLATLHGFDRPLIRALASVELVGAYDLAVRLVGPVGLVNLALMAVLEPFAYGHAQSPKTPRFVDLFVRSYVAVFGTVAMAVAVFGPEIVALLSPASYGAAAPAVPALAFAAAIEGLGRAAGIGADLAKRTRVWALASAVSLCVGMALTAVLVPRLGLLGAGLGWVAGRAISTAITYRVALRVSGIDLPIGRALAVLLAGAAIGTAAAWHPWPLLVRVSALAGFAVVVWVALGVRWHDLAGLIASSRAERAR